MTNVKTFQRFGSKKANVPQIITNAKRKLVKHLKKQPNDKKAQVYLSSLN
jgi:hypothetical protein